MTRLVEILIALNALGGIATYLGIRFAGRKTRAAGRDALHKIGIGDDDHTPEHDEHDPPPGLRPGAPPA